MSTFAAQVIPSPATASARTNGEAPPTILQSSTKLRSLLDRTGKGFISEEDVILSSFLIGFEPSLEEMKLVLSEIDLNQYKSTSNENPRLYPVLVELFRKYKVPFETLEVSISHYNKFQSPSRPDDFVLLSQLRFQIFLSLCVPFASIIRGRAGRKAREFG